MSIGIGACPCARIDGKVAVVGVIEQVERLYGDNCVITLLYFEALLQAGIDAVVVRASETVALNDVITVTCIV